MLKWWIEKMTDTREDLPQFYPPIHDLKQKVGQGGLSKSIIAKAQKVIDLNDTDFIDVAAPYMTIFEEGMALAKKNNLKNSRNVIENIIFPTVQLKANGALFHYPIITHVATKLLWFLERIEHLNEHALDIVHAFALAIDLIFKRELKGEITQDGEDIMNELNLACDRFFEKYPNNLHPRFKNQT